MASYSLHVFTPDAKTISCTAGTRSDALAIFARELGYNLTDTSTQDWDDDFMMMDEWDEGPHWVEPHIPIYRTR